MEKMKWLEPSILKRIDSVTEYCDNKSKAIDNEFRNAFDFLIKHYPDAADKLIEINDIYFNRRAAIEEAYRFGLSDGVTLAKTIGLGINYPSP